MQLVTDAQPPVLKFNPFSPAFRRDPYATYDELRARAPLHKEGPLWVLTRAADIKTVVCDLSFSSAAIRASGARSVQVVSPEAYAALAHLGEKSVVFTDRPDHTRLRRLVGKVINSKSMEQRRSHTQHRVDKAFEQYGRGSTLDFMDIAEFVPLNVMADMLGIPEDMRASVQTWTHQVRHLLEPAMMSPRIIKRVHATLNTYMDYCKSLIAERRATPGDDMISGLIGASYGDDVLSDEEICYTIIMTFVAGHETTRGLLGNGLLALLQNPDQFALLRAQPELVPNAVQEMLRYDCPLQMTQRLATRDVRICDTDITEGDTLLLCLGAANRDPDLNEDPHQFRVDRKEPTHIAFGYGIHNCLGGALATLEGEIVFRTLLERWKTVNLAPGDVQWVSESFILRGLQSLNIEVQS